MIKLLALVCLLAFLRFSNANIQANKLFKLLKSKRSRNTPVPNTWTVLNEATDEYTPVYIAPQDGLAQLDKILALPGQPEGVNFNQYSGYVTVDPNAGRALFYYFVESPTASSTKPLVLWLNGGPGCSSMMGAMTELGPFRINSDGKTLFMNDYAWSNVANMLFLESPAGVGFSYSNTSSDYDRSGDKNTADDAYVFLVNWLERFPQYKTRDFYITGESYAGHYVPQLAYTILLNNKKTNQTIINIKGIAIGNAWIDDETSAKGMFDYWWTHALNSDATHDAILKYCDFASDSSSAIGDVDARVPVTASRYSINTLNLPIETAWRPWYLNKEVGGYLEAYKGLLLITVMGAGHAVPSYQPQRALALFSSFLGGILPPSS